MGTIDNIISNQAANDVDDGFEIEENESKRKGDGKMLESNTDRSYFMIGAVVLAGIIIAAAVIIFRDHIFGDTGILTTTFKTLTLKATQAVDKIEANMITGLGSRIKLGWDMLFL